MHPLDKFKYCPVCGSDQFEVNDFKSKHCHQCGFTYYANSCSATAAFIRRVVGEASKLCSPSMTGVPLTELLIAVRAKEPAKGTLDLPGGFVDMCETAEEGIIREIKEETGLVVTSPRYLFSIPNRYLYSGFVVHTIDMFFEVTVDDDVHPRADDDAADLRWMPLDKIDPADFGLNSISQAVEKYLDSFIPASKPL